MRLYCCELITYSDADIDSDHNLVAGMLNIKLKRFKELPKVYLNGMFKTAKETKDKNSYRQCKTD